MTVEEQAKSGALMTAGCRNLGNTCYMNSTLQCLRHMPELRNALKVSPRSSNPIANIAYTLNTTFDGLDASGSAYVPSQVLQVLRSMFPQFAEGVAQMRPAQQDADELYNSFSASIKDALSGPSIIPATQWDSLLGLEIETTITCEECPEEPPVVKLDKRDKIACNIQGSQQADSTSQASQIDHLQEGLKLGLEGTITKNSEILNRNAVWKEIGRIKTLPRYLCVHFIRFDYVQNSAGGAKCKIMRKVIYPDTFDVYDFCSADLQADLRKNRDMEDKRLEDKLAKRAKTDSNSNGDAMNVEGGGNLKEGGVADGDDEDDEDDAALQAAMALSMGEGDASSTVFNSSALKASVDRFTPNGLPSDFTGMYELHSMVTHKGRSADGGHYIGWVRQEPGSNKWWKFNDDVVTEVDQSEIMLLHGGGDRDMAYLTFFRYKEPKK